MVVRGWVKPARLRCALDDRTDGFAANGGEIRTGVETEIVLVILLVIVLVIVILSVIVVVVIERPEREGEPGRRRAWQAKPPALELGRRV